MLGLGLFNCGSPGPAPQTNDASVVPDARPLDAAIPDANACACPGTELLSRQHLIDVWDYIQYGSVAGFQGCELATDQPIGGGCSYSEPGIVDSLVEQTIDFDRTGWSCVRQSIGVNVDFFIRCVRPLDRTGEIKEECACPEFETPADRVIYVDQTATQPAASVGGMEVSCPAGTTLIGGGCKGGHDSATGDALIMSAGIHPDDPQTWTCTWHVPGAKPLANLATAICLNPPGPNAVTGEAVEPEAFEHVHKEEILPANNPRIVEVDCPPGDTLIAGGCYVDDPQAQIANLRLKRSTALRPQDNRPNTWQCAWLNPTASTPKVIASASCMKPPAAVSEP
jgi:hypothetical protein